MCVVCMCVWCMCGVCVCVMCVYVCVCVNIQCILKIEIRSQLYKVSISLPGKSFFSFVFCFFNGLSSALYPSTSGRVLESLPPISQ
jgi:hypothetical protein